MERERLVLMPHGMPARAAVHQRFMRMLVSCAVDLRCISAGMSVDLFGARMAQPQERGRPPPVVAISRTAPMSLRVFGTRRSLEVRLPALRSAVWVVFHDERDHIDFLEEATKYGVFDAPIDEAPIWTTTESGEFLVVTPNAFRANLMDRIEDLLVGTRRVSSFG